MEHTVRRGVQGGLPLEALLEALETRSRIRSSKALLTRSTNILGRFCNRPYNRPYNQSPYNRLYKRLRKRLYKRLHYRPYECPYDQSINRSNAHTIGQLNAFYKRLYKRPYN